jgi:hypothetical protein
MNIETDSGLYLEATVNPARASGLYVTATTANGQRLEIHKDTWNELVQLIPIMTGWRASAPVNTGKVSGL